MIGSVSSAAVPPPLAPAVLNSRASNSETGTAFSVESMPQSSPAQTAISNPVAGVTSAVLANATQEASGSNAPDPSGKKELKEAPFELTYPLSKRVAEAGVYSARTSIENRQRQMTFDKEWLGLLTDEIGQLQDQIRSAERADLPALWEELEVAQNTLVSVTNRHNEMVKTWPDFKAENEASGAYWQASLDKLNARAAAEGLI